MPTEDPTWKRCNNCKRPIAFRATYFACSVSTCNRKATDFAFCSVGCWDAHVPLFRHRDSWADEKVAPTPEEWEREQRGEAKRTTPATSAARPAAASPSVIRRPGAAVSPGDAQAAASTPVETPREDDTSSTSEVPRDVLVVISKLKHYIRVTSGMNTSDDVVGPLSDRLRLLCDDAVERARDDGRKTVMARDFRRS
jgi:hypothetical protein